MIIVNAVLVGCVAYVGIRTVYIRRKNQQQIWLTSANPEELSASRDMGQVERVLQASSLSLALSVSGGILGSPLLSLVSVPLTLYGTLDMLDLSYKAAFQGRIRLITATTLIVVGALGTSQYFLASLAQWLYYFNEKLQAELSHNYQQLVMQFAGVKPTMVWLQLQDVEVKIPLSELRQDDIVIVNEGETIPCDGVVTDGLAIVDTYIQTGQSRPVEKKAGDWVSVSNTILSGRLSIQVKKV